MSFASELMALHAQSPANTGITTILGNDNNPSGQYSGDVQLPSWLTSMQKPRTKMLGYNPGQLQVMPGAFGNTTYGLDNYIYSGNTMGGSEVGENGPWMPKQIDPNSFIRYANSPAYQRAMQSGKWTGLNGTPYDVLDASGNVTGQKMFEGLENEDNADNYVMTATGMILGGAAAAATMGGMSGATGAGFVGEGASSGIGAWDAAAGFGSGAMEPVATMGELSQGLDGVYSLGEAGESVSGFGFGDAGESVSQFSMGGEDWFPGESPWTGTPGAQPLNFGSPQGVPPPANPFASGGAGGSGGNLTSAAKTALINSLPAELQGPASALFDYAPSLARIYAGLEGRKQAKSLQEQMRLASPMELPSPGDITSVPGYQAGLEAVQRSMAAQGYQGSGNMMAALSKYGTQAYNDYFKQRLATNAQRILGAQAQAGPAYGGLSSLALLSQGLGNLSTAGSQQSLDWLGGILK